MSISNSNSKNKSSSNDVFKVPIYYNEQTMALDKHIIKDLELIETMDPSACEPLLYYAYKPSSKLGKQAVEQLSQQYTTDTKFLEETQCLLQSYVTVPSLSLNEKDSIIALWDEIKLDTGFKEKYQYIDWSMWEYLNKSDYFLQLMSMYNLASPVISLCVPFIILIIPFFVIQVKGLKISIGEYMDVLKQIAANHAIGKLFTKFHSVKLDEKIYILLSAAFYLFSIYQNILTCVRFHQNMTKIHSYLQEVANYIQQTETIASHVLSYTSKLSTYKEFNRITQEKVAVLSTFKKQLDMITPYCLSYKKIGGLGHVLKQFYDLYQEPSYHEAFLYSFGFHGYVETIDGLAQNIREKHIHAAKIAPNQAYDKKQTNKKQNNKKQNNKKQKKIHTQLKDAYYPALIHKTPTKNSILLKKHITITGPNASGKTTILKTALINLIITQQVGCGFYKSATITPYKHFHCYLNIPDTSGRDSLFQAEARRCKEILDCIQENDIKEKHFCVFDELYSGTNPEEAVSSAYAFMKYLIQYKQVDCMLTTHFLQVCEKLEGNNTIQNCHMDTISAKDDFTYTYMLKKGISRVRGGVRVLLDMNYPKEIIEDSMKRM